MLLMNCWLPVWITGEVSRKQDVNYPVVSLEGCEGRLLWDSPDEARKSGSILVFWHVFEDCVLLLLLLLFCVESVGI